MNQERRGEHVTSVACIGRFPGSPPRCDYAAWASRHTETPLMLLHVLDEERYPAEPDLAGSIGLGSRAHLLDELADLDRKRSKLALSTATTCWMKPKRGYRRPALPKW